MGHFHSLLNPSRPVKRLSPAIANASEPAKLRKTSHRGDADTEDQNPTTSHTTQTGDREKRENPSYGHSCPQVFLSHTDHQKSFAEQLVVDLQRENISCFFDNDPQSPSDGENFPSRVSEAAEKCRVAVVVLSDEFISSEWAMQQLREFVKAKNGSNPELKILPLFFRLSFRSLSQMLQEKSSLKHFWQHRFGRKRAIDLDEWVDALEALSVINGVGYNEQEGEVAFRAEIVRAIRSLVPPKRPYDESYVQGKERLCQIVVRMVNDTPCGADGVKIAGLYGVAGTGKTTLARIACNFYSNNFDGRVLHVELGKGMPIERLKCALRILTDASNTSVNSVNCVEQGWLLFKRRMQQGRKVFLALDNVSDLPGSTEEALKYLEAVRSAGNQSTILLMARSATILRRLIPKGEGSCTHVPSLGEEEAIAVLLQLTPLKVSNLSTEEQDIAKKLALECCFRWHCTQDDSSNMPSSAYHPSALRAFGALLYDRFNSCTDLSQWIEIRSLSKPWRSGYMLKEIFSILEDSFSRLREDCRKIFMLLCLYLPQSDMTSEAVFNWLALVCDTEVEDIKLAIVELKRKGFVESIMESGHRLYIHDLYIEFAENKADGRAKWISVKERRDIPANLQEGLSSDGPRFLAAKIDNCHFQSSGFVNDELFRNVLVLHLQDMPQLKILNLSPLRIVRSITIVGCGGMQEIRGLESLRNLVYFVVKGCSTDVQFSGMERLLALQHLQIDAKLPERTTESSPLSWTSSPPLQSARIEKGGTRRLDLSACSKLRTIKLSQCDMVQIDLTGCLELREIEIVECKNLSEISLFNPNLASLETQAICSTLKSRSRLGPAFSNLSELRLEGMRSLKELPTLTGLTALQNLSLEKMHSLKELPTLTGLAALQILRLEGMHNLKELPTLTGLTALGKFQLEGMHSLEELPTLTGLTALQDLRLEGMHNLKELPTLTGLNALWNLELKGMHSLKELPTLTGLTALQNLRLEGLYSLKELPNLTGLTALQDLRLEGLYSLKELPNLTGLTALQGLELEGMHNLKELPTFTGLNALWNLELKGMHSLKELPTLTGLTALKNLRLEGMHNMTELPTLTGLTALQDFQLEGMHSLKEFPTVAGLTELKSLWLEGVHGLKELPSLTGLTALQNLWLEGLHSLKELPTLTGLTALEHVRLEGMHSLTELPTLTGLTALQIVQLEGMHGLIELPTLTGFNRWSDIHRRWYFKSRETLVHFKRMHRIP